jgi:hypothetical protein
MPCRAAHLSQIGRIEGMSAFLSVEAVRLVGFGVRRERGLFVCGLGSFGRRALKPFHRGCAIYASACLHEDDVQAFVRYARGDQSARDAGAYDQDVCVKIHRKASLLDWRVGPAHSVVAGYAPRPRKGHRAPHERARVVDANHAPGIDGLAGIPIGDDSARETA